MSQYIKHRHYFFSYLKKIRFLIYLINALKKNKKAFTGVILNTSNNKS